MMNFASVRRHIVAVAVVAATFSAPAPARADAIEDFYKGRSISIVLVTTPGGPYDILARVVSRHIGAHIPGKPSVSVKNMPGGGGMVGANWLYNVAEKDGSIIGAMMNITPFEPAFGTDGVRYDPLKFTWLGSPDPETNFLTVWKTTPVDTIDDLRKTEITVASSGPASSPAFYARLEMEVLKVKLKIIHGYPGQAEAFLAMENGEVNGYASVSWSSLTAFKPNWVRDKSVKFLLQMGVRSRPEFPDVPNLIDLVTDPDDHALVQAALALSDLPRPYALPPGVPGERAEAIKRAMRAMFADPAFLADAKQAGLPIEAPQGAEDVQRIIDRVYNAPPKIIERLRKLKQ